MSKQAIPGSKKEQEKSANVIEGLTPGERQRLEESMQRNEKLMKRLAEMWASEFVRVFLKPNFDFIDLAFVAGDS